MKKIIVKFDEEAYEEYLKLKNNLLKKSSKKPTPKQLLYSIDKTIKEIKLNPFIGDLIPQKYLNNKIISKYGTNKIFRIELIGFWRLIYTVVGEEAHIIALILDYFDHKEYNKLFKYRNK